MDRFDDETFDDETRQSNPFDSLRDPLGILRRRWRPMLLVMLAGLAATPLAMWLLPPVYVARASVLIATQLPRFRPVIQEDATEINALTSRCPPDLRAVEQFVCIPNCARRRGWTRPSQHSAAASASNSTRASDLPESVRASYWCTSRISRQRAPRR
jgi:hypothetical protein